MSITLLTLTASSRAPAMMQLKPAQPLPSKSPAAGKACPIPVGKWVEGEGFRVAINHGGNERSGSLKLYF